VSRIVVVSSYPPRHCGIGAYAAAQVERLLAGGHDVVVVSPPDGAGDVRVPFFGGRPFREARRISRPEDGVLVQFQPALYYRPRAPVSKVAASLELWRLARRRPRTEVLVHEADRPIRWRPDYVLLRRAFAAAPALLFHTARERDRLETWYRVRTRSRLIDHREGIRPAAIPSRPEARRVFGLPEDETVFVSPGFLHPDKGFERAIGALDDAGRLYVVGSIKDPTPANLAYAERLRRLAAETPGVELVERYVDEDELDRWVAAADAVVLPYRRSWSSGALARAQAVGVPAIVSDAGGLPEQAGQQDVVVRDDAELAAVLRRVAAERRGAVRR
jgi:glycosyltransferase involved in cell wall biosynthesis